MMRVRRSPQDPWHRPPPPSYPPAHVAVLPNLQSLPPVAGAAAAAAVSRPSSDPTAAAAGCSCCSCCAGGCVFTLRFRVYRTTIVSPSTSIIVTIEAESDPRRSLSALPFSALPFSRSRSSRFPLPRFPLPLFHRFCCIAQAAVAAAAAAFLCCASRFRRTNPLPGWPRATVAPWRSHRRRRVAILPAHYAI